MVNQEHKQVDDHGQEGRGGAIRRRHEPHEAVYSDSETARESTPADSVWRAATRSCRPGIVCALTVRSGAAFEPDDPEYDTEERKHFDDRDGLREEHNP